MKQKLSIEEDIHFLVFWGKLDRESVIHMPVWKRKYWVEKTIESLKIQYGQND